MPNRLVRRSLFVVVSALSAATVAGCGVNGAGGDEASRLVASGVAPRAREASYLARAAQATGAVATEKVSLTVRTTPAEGDPSVTVTAAGEVDRANGRARLTADVAGTVGGRSDQVAVEAVYEGDTVYVKGPFTQLLGDAPWVKVSSPKLGALAEHLGGGLPGDPGSFLELLEGAGGTVTTVGTDDVRGVPTRQVEVDLDVERLLDQAAGERRARIEEQLTRHGVDLSRLGPIPAEAWIDDEGYVRRFTVAFDLAKLGQAEPGIDATGVITQTIELYDFDEPVDIAVPAADQVTTFDVEELFGGFTRPGEGKAGGKGGDGAGD